ncbi:MAG: Rne/Rng family ribonuclease [Pseudomonadota bacterium]|nr:Rne/Rng family ribonuclease [Pseudomonadota bacterium]
MAEEYLVNVTPQETRVAAVENGVLQEIIIERRQKKGLVGNIYLGRVSRVLPGMQAAFVDIGLDRTAFLHLHDILDFGPEHDVQANNDTAIDRLLREGDEIVVQVTKDPLIGKGARLTTRLCIPSRYLVLIPRSATVGVSQKIADELERTRLREVILNHDAGLKAAAEAPAAAQSPVPGRDLGACPGPSGYIVRTAAEGVAEDILQMDMEFLQRLWSTLSLQLGEAKAPGVIYEDLPLVLRTMRSLVAGEVEKIRIDSRETYERVSEFARQYIPDLVDRIEHYSGERPILDLYSVESEIQRALERRVELKSGGHLVFDQTEAMTTVDVNTGAFVGHRNLEETIFKTNLEAAQAIARQLRLRNLGGIVIVDFIDMEDADHQSQVLRALEKGLERDHARVAVSEITSLGLVQITRQRTRESLEHVLCEPCPTCGGRGSTKTAETVCYEILREILREVRQFDAKKLLVIASPCVADRLLDEESAGVAELEGFIGRPITVRAEAIYGPEQYDVVLL